MLQRTDYLEKTGEHPLKSGTDKEFHHWFIGLALGRAPCHFLESHAQASHWSVVSLLLSCQSGRINFHFHLALQELGEDWPLVC